jgi:hypothetical protein
MTLFGSLAFAIPQHERALGVVDQAFATVTPPMPTQRVPYRATHSREARRSLRWPLSARDESGDLLDDGGI